MKKSLSSELNFKQNRGNFAQEKLGKRRKKKGANKEW